MCLTVFTVETWKARENLDVVVGEELCGVACCMGSRVVPLKYSAIQRLMPKTKNSKKICAF